MARHAGAAVLSIGLLVPPTLAQAELSDEFAPSHVFTVARRRAVETAALRQVNLPNGHGRYRDHCQGDF